MDDSENELIRETSSFDQERYCNVCVYNLWQRGERSVRKRTPRWLGEGRKYKTDKIKISERLRL